MYVLKKLLKADQITYYTPHIRIACRVTIMILVPFPGPWSPCNNNMALFLTTGQSLKNCTPNIVILSFDAKVKVKVKAS